MMRQELQELWGQTLCSDEQQAENYERLAAAVVEVYRSDDEFKQHVKNRAKRVTESTGQPFDADVFDREMANAFIADEIGVKSWAELVDAVTNGFPGGQAILFRYAVAALWRGDFTALDETIGHDNFDGVIKSWYERGYFEDEPETFAEAFAASCWLGHTKTVAYLLDNGVDPYAGMRTGLAGFHWAASNAKVDVIKLLVSRGIPMEIENMYEGTVLGQALWSAINEFTPGHAEVIETLIAGGAHVWPDTLKWWESQDVPSAETKTRVANALRQRESADGKPRNSKI